MFNFSRFCKRQFSALLQQVKALRSITFTFRCQSVVLVVCLRYHMLSYNVVFIKFPWKFNFLKLAVPHSGLLHLKPASVSLI